MVADALQDIFRDRKKLREMEDKMNKPSVEEPGSELFEDYLKTVDIHLVERGMAFKPAKSVEFGKTDQSMLNHIRNGILFLLRFNEALGKLGVRTLDGNGLRECISLFVVHDLHKLKYEEWKLDDDLLELPDTMENEFEVPKSAITNFINEMHLGDFAPSLKDEDFFQLQLHFIRAGFLVLEHVHLISWIWSRSSISWTPWQAAHHLKKRSPHDH